MTILVHRERVRPPVGSIWPRGLYVIVVSVILARWYVTVRPLDSGRNTTRYHENNTCKRTHVAAVARRSRHERYHPRMFRKKARGDVVSELNVSFRLCTSRGTSGSSLKRPSAEGSQCWATVYYHPARITLIHIFISLITDCPSCQHPSSTDPATALMYQRLTLSSRVSRRFLWGHIADRNYPKYIEMFYLRGLCKRESFIGSTRFRDETRTRHHCALWLVFVRSVTSLYSSVR